MTLDFVRARNMGLARVGLVCIEVIFFSATFYELYQPKISNVSVEEQRADIYRRLPGALLPDYPSMVNHFLRALKLDVQYYPPLVGPHILCPPQYIGCHFASDKT